MPTSFALFVTHECETEEKKDLSILWYLWNTLNVYYMYVRIAIIASASAVLR